MNPKHSFGSTGFKNISLEVTLNNGCKNLITKQIEINTGAKPLFSYEDFCGDEPVSFTNQTISNAPPNDIYYKWEFGDGGTSLILAPVYNYFSTAGKIYNVKLITNVLGDCHDTIIKPVYAGEVAICDFQIVPKYVPGHRGYEFVPDSTHYSTYEWSFGDQKTSDEVSPVHQYEADGNYTVKLEANSVDNCNCELTFDHQVLNLSTDETDYTGGILLYPNPTTGVLNIQVQNLSIGLRSVKITDMAGKTVLDFGTNQYPNQSEFELNVSQLVSGTYQIMFDTQEGYIVKRFILIR
jgi:hypothetical protein